MNSYFLSAHFNKYHSFPIISEVFLRISKVILFLSKEISSDTPWKEWGRHGISHHISLKVPERRETHEKGMGKNGKENGQELNGNDGKCMGRKLNKMGENGKVDGGYVNLPFFRNLRIFGFAL